MKILIMAIAVLLAVACNNNISPSHTVYRNQEIINAKGMSILLGNNAPYMMKQGIYKEWFDKNYQEYVPDSGSILALQKLVPGKTMEVFLGSWCGDSKREVPRMMKILEQAGFDSADLRLVFVDYVLPAYKQSPQHEEKGKDIHHVPTFILYDGNKEMGRIVESPVISLEKDLTAILKREVYTPNYRAILQWQKDTKQRNKTKTDEEIRTIAVSLKPICHFWGEFNGYAYMLYAGGRTNEAHNIFRLNAILFPDKPGPFSGLGEYYFLSGDKARARRCYEKVLELKPGDANATKMLAQL